MLTKDELVYSVKWLGCRTFKHRYCSCTRNLFYHPK